MPKPLAHVAETRCVHPSMRAARTVSLPVVHGSNEAAGARTDANTIRPSRSGRRRAIVLASVQGLMIAHVVLWVLSKRTGWFYGRTTTPIEPSESMEFAKHGLINAGLIFFSVALLSTLILGRWFCGWGCHIVMLQDFCGWLMKRIGVRPKPFRSRFLIYVPLLLALYMFLWPAIARTVALPLQAWLATKWSAITAPRSVAPWGLHTQLTTTEFWKTFPGVMVAIPFLFVCGFATVYFLGAKGFCTYGCPYGGFFAPLDKFAVGKIRVTDACEGCGHCTAVCTSNVRVHEEVREYGMVVDPGCMKCMDCVSVCPNDALYFGLGKPTIMKGEAKNEAPSRKYDLTLGDEFLCAGVFALTFFCTRGVYGLVPMLMAAGLAGCVTFMAWKLWRMLRDSNVTLHRYQLKLRGRAQRAGLLSAGATALTLLLVLHSGAVKAANVVAEWHDDRVTVAAAIVFAGQFDQIGAPMRQHADRALHWYGVASSIPSGGMGLSTADQGAIDIRRAWLHCVRNEFDHAEMLLRGAFRRQPNEATATALVRMLRNRSDQAKSREALDLCELQLTEHPEYTGMLGDFEAVALELGQGDRVIAVHRARLQRDRFNLPSLRSLSLLLLQNGQYDEGLALTGRWVEADPTSAEAHRMRGAGFAAIGAENQAIAEMRLAVQYSPPDDRINHNMLADMLDAIGRTQEAAAIRQGH